MAEWQCEPALQLRSAAMAVEQEGKEAIIKNEQTSSSDRYGRDYAYRFECGGIF